MIMTRSSLVRAAVLLIALPVACVDAAQAKRGSWHARGARPRSLGGKTHGARGCRACGAALTSPLRLVEPALGLISTCS